jgi:hypothetical protein
MGIIIIIIIIDDITIIVKSRLIFLTGPWSSSSSSSSLLISPLKGKAIDWPEDEVLAVAMAEFKQSKMHTGVKMEAATSNNSPSHDPNG